LLEAQERITELHLTPTVVLVAAADILMLLVVLALLDKDMLAVEVLARLTTPVVVAAAQVV
jgi:hypothetical protein